MNFFFFDVCWLMASPMISCLSSSSCQLPAGFFVPPCESEFTYRRRTFVS